MPFNALRRAALCRAAIYLAVVLLLGSFGLDAISGRAAPPQPGLSLENSAQFPSLVLRAEYIPDAPPVYIPAPEAASPLAGPFSAAAPQATIHVTYLGTWNPAARQAFEYAKHIWELYLASPVVIEVNAEWKTYPSDQYYILGSASASGYWRQFQGAPDPNTWYPVALASRLAGSDLAPNAPDIEAAFNSAFHVDQGWYFGTDGKVDAHHWDFVSVVLHELGHGLGFSSSMQVNNGSGSWGLGSGYPFIFDRYTVNGSAQALINTQQFANPSPALAAQLQSDQVYFNGSRARAASGGALPRLYAPAPWQGGSSLSHLNEDSYPAAGGNSLMTPKLINGEAMHAPGPIALGVMSDLGWAMGPGPAPAPTATPIPTPKPRFIPASSLYFPIMTFRR